MIASMIVFEVSGTTAEREEISGDVEEAEDAVEIDMDDEDFLASEHDDDGRSFGSICG